MTPIALDEVEIGTVRGQINDLETMFKERTEGFDNRGVVIRGVIHHQNNGLVGINFKHQPFQKMQEGLATELGGEVGMNGIRRPVISATEATATVGLSVADSRNAELLPPFLPALAQWCVQVETGFVHKDELGIGCERPFFSSSSKV